MKQYPFSFDRINPIKPASFEELRTLTELFYVWDKLQWKLRPYKFLLMSFGIRTEITMPRQNNTNAYSEWRFVNLSLSRADEEGFVKWMKANVDTIIVELSGILADGYKHTISYDFDNECFISTLSGTKNTTQNVGCSLSSRSAEFIEALGLTVYKHRVMAENGNWADYARPSNWG